MRSFLKTVLLLTTLGLAGNISHAQLAGTITVPSVTYPTLASAITALNTQGVGTGGATISLTAGNAQTAPSGGYQLGSATLNASLSAANPLTISGNGNTVTANTGTGSYDGIFILKGVDYVTINALNLTDAASNTTTTTQMEWGFALVKLNTSAPFDGCQHNTISNCTITLLNNVSGSNSTAIYAAHISSTGTALSTTGVAAGDGNSYNVFSGNTISGVVRGFYLYGISTSAATYDKANMVGGATTGSGNTVTVGSLSSTAYGVYSYYDSTSYFRNNTFAIASTSSATVSVYEVYKGTGVGNMTVTNNTFNISSSLTSGYTYCFYSSSGYGDATSTVNITGNTLTGTNSVVTSGYLYGFYMYYMYALTENFSNNNFTNINWGATTTPYTSTAYIYLAYQYYGGVNNLTVDNNQVNNLTRYTPGTSSSYLYGFYFYNYNATGGVFNYTNNKFKNVRNSAYYTYPNYVYAGYNVQKMISKYNKVDSVDISNNTYYGYMTNYFSYYGMDSSEVAYDTVSNVKNLGTYTSGGSISTYFIGYGYYGTNAYSSHHNYVNNINTLLTSVNTYFGYYASGPNAVVSDTLSNVNTTNGSITTYLGYYGTNPDIKNNSVTNLTSTGSGTITNYLAYYSTAFKAHNNVLNNLSVGTGTCYASEIYSNSGAEDSVYNNNISNVTVTTGTTNTVYMSYIGGTANVSFYNNFISGLTVPTTYVSTNLYGIYLASNIIYKLYHNTIYLKPLGSQTQMGLTGIYYQNSTTGSLDLRNNIINLGTIAGGTGTVVALRRAGGTAGTTPANYASSSNGNIFYVPTATNNYLYAEGTSTPLVNAYNITTDPNFNTPCGLYKTFMAGRDGSSFTENNLVAGTLANTYVPTGISYAKSVGVATTNPYVGFDYANVTRPAVSPDAGALQFTGTALDASAPAITYTAFPSTSYCTTAPTLTATITDVTGVNTTTGTAPRLYYKKSTDANAFGVANNSTGNGWKYVEGTASGSTFTFALDYNLLQSAAVVGDVIQYFVIAQDVATTPNVGANLVGFPGTFCPSSVALPAAAGPLNATPAPNSFTITTQPTTFAVGQTYKSLCNSGTTTLSLTPVPNGTFVQWQQSVGGAAFTSIAGANSSTYTTPLLTTTTVFRAQIYCGSTVAATTLNDTIIVANPTLLSTTPATRCGVGTVTLAGSANTGSTVTWYQTATSSTALATGNSFTTPSIGGTTTYYASAVVPGASTEIVTKPTAVYYSYTYGTGYGLNMHFNAPSTIYSTTVYVNGTGTFNVQLQDSATGGTLATSATFSITGVGGAGITAPVVLQLNLPVTAANIAAANGGFRLVQNVLTGSPNLNYEYGTMAYPYVSPSGNAMITGSWLYGSFYNTNSGAYYGFFYNVNVSGPCSSSRTAVTATVTPAPAITASSPNVPGICTGATATLNVASSNAGYTYNWTPGSGLSCSTCTTTTATPAATTYFVVTATDLSGGANNGCVAKDSVKINVNAQPAAPVLSPGPSNTICLGSQVTLTSSTGSGSPTIFSENFTNATTASPGIFTITPGPTNANVSALAPWQIVTAPYTNSGGSSETFGGTGNKYIHADANSNSAQTSTYFTTTNSYNTTNYTTLALNFNEFYQTYPNDSAAVDVSTNNGATWTNVYNIGNSGTVGTSYTTFAPASINLNSYVGVSQLKVRFRYVSGYGWYWAVDDIVLSGTPLPVATNWLNVNGLYKNTTLSSALTSTDTNKVVYASPASTQVYTAVANLLGCISVPSAPDTVKVNPLPDASIAANPGATICAGQTTTLTAGQTGTGYTYQWYSSGTIIAGATGNSYTTGTAGIYTVKIINTVTGCQATTATPTSLVVNPLPIATATAAGPTTFCNGGNVQLTANTGAGFTYQWLNNSIAISGANGSSYFANATGNYSVIVTNANTCSSTSNAVAVTVNTTPAVITPQGTTTFCTGYNVVLQGNTGANLTYQWQVGGTSIPGATSSSYTASATGSYSLFVTNTATGCSSLSAPVQVTVGAPPTSNITPAGAIGVCDGNSLTLSTNPSPGLVYQWYKNGTAIAGANGQTYTQVFTIGGGGGSYTVNVSSGVGCSSTTTTPTVVTVNPLPAVTIAAGGATTFCQGYNVVLSATPATGLTYQWYNGSTVVTGATSATYTATASGSYTVKGTNANGCVGTSNAISITVNPLPVVTATAAGATTFCQGNSVVLSATPATGLTYQWKLNTNPISGATTSSYTATASGIYTVTATNSNGCANTSNVIPVIVNPLPSVALTPAGMINICSGTTTTITVPTGSGYTYQWTNIAGNIPGATGASYTTGVAGSYNVTVTNTATGCQATSAQDTVIVNPLPTAVATANITTICQGDTALFTANAGAGYSYQWKLNGNNIIGATGISYGATQPGVYTVVVKNAFGCTTVSNTITLTVNPAPQAFITYNSPISFCMGGAVVLNANQGTGLTYQWLLNGQPIGNTTGSNISTQQGAYTLKVTNTYGCVTTSAPVNVTVWQMTPPSITMNNFILSTGTYASYQWFFNNQPIPGATAQNQIVVANGAYKVKVMDVHNCEANSEQYFVNGLGITSTVSVRNAIKVYPNPASTIIHIDAPVKVNVVLRDVTGKAVISEEAAKEINVDGIANGLYLLYISDAQGHLLKAEKIAKTNN